MFPLFNLLISSVGDDADLRGSVLPDPELPLRLRPRERDLSPDRLLDLRTAPPDARLPLPVAVEASLFVLLELESPCFGCDL